MSYILIYIGSVFVSSVSQVLLKSSAGKTYDSIWQEYLNPKVIFAYGMFFASSLITILAYKGVPLSMGPILEASGYIFVAVLSYLFLREKISKRKLAGLLAILIGIVVFSI
ncbi:MAG: multidrug ABC transporter [Lachnospiraceae bacterium]|nr:multidrug ABC transporter [Lachnospiraceae bacterium]